MDNNDSDQVKLFKRFYEDGSYRTPLATAYQQKTSITIQDSLSCTLFCSSFLARKGTDLEHMRPQLDGVIHLEGMLDAFKCSSFWDIVRTVYEDDFAE